MEAVFVAEGEMVEKVFYGFDAAIREVRGYAVADAFDVFDRGVEVERHGLMVAVVELDIVGLEESIPQGLKPRFLPSYETRP